MSFTPAQLAAIAAQPGYSIDTPSPACEAIRVEDFHEAMTKRHDLQAPLFNQTLAGFCQEWGFADDLVFEHKFHPRRKWRFDAAIPSIMVAVELEGGIWMQTENGRSAGHAHPKRFESDIEKYNTAALMGWFVLRFTSEMVKDGRMVATLQELPPF